MSSDETVDKNDEARLQHDFKGAVRRVRQFVDLEKSGFDFKSKEAAAVIESAENAIVFLEDFLEKYLKRNRLS